MASIPSAMGVAVEKFHHPTVGIAGYIQEGKLIKQGRIADRISKALLKSKARTTTHSF